MNLTYIILSLFLIILLIILVIATNYGLKVTIMYNRKDKQTMIDELLTNFNTDYSLYQSLPTEEISIKSDDNMTLRGVYHNVHPESKKIVIINHGYTANRYVCYQFTDVFFEEGYNVLLIDMRSHGESEGTFASYGHYESNDIGCWIKWIQNKVSKDAYIGLHGQSMGAATVMIYGGTHPNEVKFVIEDCGFNTAKDAIKSQFSEAKIPFWPLYHLIRLKAKRKYKFDLNRVSPEAAIINSSIPTLFIHGTSDKIVPSWMAKVIFEKKNGPKDKLYLVEGAGHMESYSKDKENYKKTVKNFLNHL